MPFRSRKTASFTFLRLCMPLNIFSKMEPGHDLRTSLSVIRRCVPPTFSGTISPLNLTKDAIWFFSFSHWIRSSRIAYFPYSIFIFIFLVKCIINSWLSFNSCLMVLYSDVLFSNSESIFWMWCLNTSSSCLRPLFHI